MYGTLVRIGVEAGADAAKTAMWKFLVVIPAIAFIVGFILGALVF